MPRSRKASFMLSIWPDDLDRSCRASAASAARRRSCSMSPATLPRSRSWHAGIDVVDRLDVGLVGVGRQRCRA